MEAFFRRSILVDTTNRKKYSHGSKEQARVPAVYELSELRRLFGNPDIWCQSRKSEDEQHSIHKKVCEQRS
jgi:hypothetical protein